MTQAKAPFATRRVLAPHEPESVIASTWLALLKPTRLAPILCVCVPLLFVQHVYSRDANALWIGVVMCAAFVLIAPATYRLLFPDGIDWVRGVPRIALYGLIGTASIFVAGFLLPHWAGASQTFLTARASLLVEVALFLAGGWGLGRDISLEFSLARERERAAALSREAERAQLLALKANLDPHFLFNTLNAIAEWCRTDGIAAERAVLELAALLRAVLEGIDGRAWPLARELEVCKTLLSLHRMRDPNRFTLEWDVDDSLARDVEVPPMLLFAIVENAVTHGPEKGHRGAIRVAVTRDGERTLVRVENPGPLGSPRRGSHGLPTVERRLALAYDGLASFRLFADDAGARTIATIELGARTPKETA